MNSNKGHLTTSRFMFHETYLRVYQNFDQKAYFLFNKILKNVYLERFIYFTEISSVWQHLFCKMTHHIIYHLIKGANIRIQLLYSDKPIKLIHLFDRYFIICKLCWILYSISDKQSNEICKWYFFKSKAVNSRLEISKYYFSIHAFYSFYGQNDQNVSKSIISIIERKQGWSERSSVLTN